MQLDTRRPPRAAHAGVVPGRHAAQSRPASRIPAEPGPAIPVQRAAPPSTPRRAAARHGAAGADEGSARRAIAAGVLGGIALSLMIYQYQFRDLEAYVAAHLFGVVTPVLAAANAPIIWFGLPGDGAFGLVITPDCSSALLLVPLCGVGMLLMIPRKLRVGRTLKALTVAAVLLVSGNLLRIAVIAVTTRLGGLGAGYEFGHLVLGSFISIVGIAISLTLLIAIVTGQDGIWLRDRFRRHRKGAS